MHRVNPYRVVAALTVATLVACGGQTPDTKTDDSVQQPISESKPSAEAPAPVAPSPERPAASQPAAPELQSFKGLSVGDTWDDALPKLNAIGPREDLIRLDPDAWVDVRGGRRFTFRRPSEPDLGPYRIVSIR
jgi:hypothetical protein